MLYPLSYEGEDSHSDAGEGRAAHAHRTVGSLLAFPLDLVPSSSRVADVAGGRQGRGTKLIKQGESA